MNHPTHPTPARLALIGAGLGIVSLLLALLLLVMGYEYALQLLAALAPTALLLAGLALVEVRRKDGQR